MPQNAHLFTGGKYPALGLCEINSVYARPTCCTYPVWDGDTSLRGMYRVKWGHEGKGRDGTTHWKNEYWRRSEIGVMRKGRILSLALHRLIWCSSETLQRSCLQGATLAELAGFACSLACLFAFNSWSSKYKNIMSWPAGRTWGVAGDAYRNETSKGHKQRPARQDVWSSWHSLLFTGSICTG